MKRNRKLILLIILIEEIIILLLLELIIFRNVLPAPVSNDVWAGFLGTYIVSIIGFVTTYVVVSLEIIRNIRKDELQKKFGPYLYYKLGKYNDLKKYAVWGRKKPILLNRMERSVQKMKSVEQNEGFQKRYYEALTPSADIENGQEYMAALDWAIHQQDIQNIAISGPYGSGKSSVIRSYLKNHEDFKPLWISLAAFNLDNMKVRKDEGEKGIDEKQLEIGILKQLFYSVGADKIPQSRYRKLQPEKKRKNILRGLLLMFLVCVVLCFTLPDKVEIFIKRIHDFCGILSVLVYGVVVGVTWTACTLFVGWFRKNGSIQEVKVLDKATFKNEKGNNESIFSKNMDEIVYFFEETGYQFVVIEDLDRFRSTNIFVALRELNNLLNHYEKIKDKITFIYAIKDDMFEEEGERTKFFDFIIPIVPYISSTNSGEILREKLLFDDLENRSRIYDISGGFISLISPYISDMRDLTCICNEFNIYRNTLKSNQELKHLIDEKMFSLIVFKNLYPKDFAELEDETKSSIVRRAFANKHDLIKKQEELINVKRQNENEIIKEVESEVLNTVRELKLALFGCLMNFQASIREIVVDRKEYYMESMLKDEFDINELRGKRLTVYYSDASSSNRHTDIDDIEQVIEENGGNYFERITRVQKGLATCKEESRRKIEKCEKEINELRTWSIRRFIERFGTDFLEECVKENDLLVFFLRHGYIDEQYESYINYFHPNSITKEEMNFVLGVRNHRFEADYSYPLKNVARIFDRLQDFEFLQKEVLNYELVDFVLENMCESQSACRLIEQLSNHTTESMSFVKAYIERGKNTEILIKWLCQENQIFWADVTYDDGISIETCFKYLELIFMYADIADIVEQDRAHYEDKEEGVLSEFLISQPLVLENIKDVPTEKQINILDELDIKFIDVELNEVDEEVKKDIFENCRYALNKEMIQRLVEWKAHELVNDLSEKNYTTIMRLDYEPLLDYAHKNFRDYILEMVVEPESNVNEELDAVEDILERLLFEEDADLCIVVLDKEPVVWDDISSCCGNVEEEDKSVQNIWDYLLSHNRVSCTWDNFIKYYEKFGATETWSEYLNEKIDILLADNENPLITEDIKSAILLSDIGEESFKKYISKIDIDPYEGKLEYLSETKLKAMIEKSKLPYSMEYWDNLANIAPELRISYAEQNKNDFIASIEDIELFEKEVNSMLISDVFAPEDKKLILSKIDVSTLSIVTAEIIRGLNFTVDREYVDAAWKVLPKNGRYELLLNQLDVYENSELPILFSELAPEYRQLVKRTRHKYTFACTDYNKALLNKLLQRDYVTSIEKEKQENATHLFDVPKAHIITGYVKQSKV